MIDFHIEPMGRQYLDGVYAVESDSFSVPWSFCSFEEELSNPLAIYMVALANSEVVGFAGMHHVLDVGHITNIAVIKNHRRHGIGDALVEKLTEIAKAKRMVGITLEVRMGNAAAMRLYAKHGFTPHGIRKNYYTDTKEDAVVMWKHF